VVTVKAGNLAGHTHACRVSRRRLAFDQIRNGHADNRPIGDLLSDARLRQRTMRPVLLSAFRVVGFGNIDGDAFVSIDNALHVREQSADLV